MPHASARQDNTVAQRATTPAKCRRAKHDRCASTVASWLTCNTEPGHRDDIARPAPPLPSHSTNTLDCG
eukprot:717696-Alexandrium_andersonii.AAC.1